MAPVALVDLTPPLVFSYFGGARKLKLLATHDGADCELHLECINRMCWGAQRLGAFLLVHTIRAEHPEVAMQAEAEHIQRRIDEVLEMAAEDGAEDGALASLQEDLVLQMYIDVEAAGARAESRRDAGSAAHGSYLPGSASCCAHQGSIQVLEVQEGGEVEPPHKVGQALLAAVVAT